MRWLIGLIVALVTAIFGTDKPREVEVNDAPSPDGVVPSDDDLLDDLGVGAGDDSDDA